MFLEIFMVSPLFKKIEIHIKKKTEVQIPLLVVVNTRKTLNLVKSVNIENQERGKQN